MTIQHNTDGTTEGRDPRAMTPAELRALGHRPMPVLAAIRASSEDRFPPKSTIQPGAGAEPERINSRAEGPAYRLRAGAVMRKAEQSVRFRRPGPRIPRPTRPLPFQRKPPSEIRHFGASSCLRSAVRLRRISKPRYTGASASVAMPKRPARCEMTTAS